MSMCCMGWVECRFNCFWKGLGKSIVFSLFFCGWFVLVIVLGWYNLMEKELDWIGMVFSLLLIRSICFNLKCVFRVLGVVLSNLIILLIMMSFKVLLVFLLNSGLGLKWFIFIFIVFGVVFLRVIFCLLVIN